MTCMVPGWLGETPSPCMGHMRVCGEPRLLTCPLGSLILAPLDQGWPVRSAGPQVTSVYQETRHEDIRAERHVDG